LYRIIIYFLVIFGIFSCTGSSDQGSSPTISFIGLSKNTLVQGIVATNDTIKITIQFEDSDGDLGFLPEEQTGTFDVYVIDNRTAETYDRYRLPHFPEQGASNGVEGQIEFTLLSSCCIFPDGIPPCEAPELYPTNEFTLGLYIVDRAGNQSNTIETSSITMFCD